jgi:hypothetical protein
MNNAEFFAFLRRHLADRYCSRTHTREILKMLDREIWGFSGAEIAVLRVLRLELVESAEENLRPPGTGTI